jgi:hypothetical protein
MSEPIPSPVKTPWHLWVVGVLSLLWNAMGLMDFTMTMTKNEAYMSNFTEEQLAYFYSFPLWLNIAWGIAVIGSVLGSLLLILRMKIACPVFALSFLSMVVTTIYNFGLSNGLEMMGGIGPLIFSAVIFVVALLLVIYAKAMGKKGVLK